MYIFKEEDNLKAFDEFVVANKGSYLQSAIWPKAKKAWKPRYYAGFGQSNEMVLTCLVLERDLPIAGHIWYISCGPLCDYENVTLISEFSIFLKNEMKKFKVTCSIIDPLIPLRIDGESQPEGERTHKMLTEIGYTLNADIDSYTYKHPVQMYIPLKDDEGKLLSGQELLKKCEKGVRYSVRVGSSRGLVTEKFTCDEICENEKIMKDFMTVMHDTSTRNSFVERDAEYCTNLIKTLGEYSDISIVYYDKKLDKKLELQRRDKRALLVEELKEAPVKKQKGLKDEIEVIDKNTASYKARLAETENYSQDERIAVAAGLTIHFGGIGSCVFGGTRDLLRNNTRSSHYLNYQRICDSIDKHCDFHDLGYILVKNPKILSNGTLGELVPKENFSGINDFKKSFGAKKYEFIGEYILVGNRLKYIMYRYLMPIAKKTKIRFVKLLRRHNKGL